MSRAGEILETVPGLIVTQHSGSGKANQYFLRGFNLDHGTDFATFVDGMPVNMVTHAHGQGEQPRTLYSVRFDAREIFGEAAEANQRIYLDLWESYLEPGEPRG